MRVNSFINMRGRKELTASFSSRYTDCIQGQLRQGGDRMNREILEKLRVITAEEGDVAVNLIALPDFFNTTLTAHLPRVNTIKDEWWSWQSSSA